MGIAPDSGGGRDRGRGDGGGADAASAKGIPGARAEWREYQYSGAQDTPMATMRGEEVNIGVIVADRSAGRVHRRLRAMYGSGHPALRVTEPGYLHLPPHDHEGAAEWMYQATRPRGRELSVDQKRAGMSGAEHPDRGEHWFASIQYVPDAIRDEAVNVGLAVADKASGMTIVRYVEGAKGIDVAPRGRRSAFFAAVAGSAARKANPCLTFPTLPPFHSTSLPARTSRAASRSCRTASGSASISSVSISPSVSAVLQTFWPANTRLGAVPRSTPSGYGPRASAIIK